MVARICLARGLAEVTNDSAESSFRFGVAALCGILRRAAGRSIVPSRVQFRCEVFSVSGASWFQTKFFSSFQFKGSP